jgi:hypothetical protein
MCIVEMFRALQICIVACIIAVLHMAVRNRKRMAVPISAGEASSSTIVPHSVHTATIHRGLVPHSTRTGVAAILSRLHEQGLLTDGALGGSCSSIRRKLRIAMEAHSKVDTPYGTVVKTLSIGDGLPTWEYCCPMALIYYLSTVSKPFYDVMVSSSMHGRPLRIILYVDGCEPGNPLRPESERELQCIYWTFADLPAWLLCRTGSWFVYGFLRDCITNQMAGKLADLMRRILHTFFPINGHSFTRGIIITNPCGDSSRVIQGMFAGILADESAHKYVGDMKGASGTKPCMSCSNIVSVNITILTAFCRTSACVHAAFTNL